MTNIDTYISLIDRKINTFCLRNGMSKSRFGLLAVHDDKIAGRVERGIVHVRTLRRIEAFMASYKKSQNHGNKGIWKDPCANQRQKSPSKVMRQKSSLSASAAPVSGPSALPLTTLYATKQTRATGLNTPSTERKTVTASKPLSMSPALKSRAALAESKQTTSAPCSKPFQNCSVKPKPASLKHKRFKGAE